MNLRLTLGVGAAVLALVSCSNKRDLGNLPDGGSAGAAGTGSGTAGQGGQVGGAAGTGGAGGGGAGGTTGAAGATGAAGTTGTAGTGGGGSGGNGGAPAACDVTSPFGTPVLVAGVNQSGSASANARLTPDELTTFFISDRGGNSDIYTATRTSRTAAFGMPQPLAGVNSSANENCPSVTSDSLTFFLESNRAGQFGVFVASRSDTFTQFSAPSQVAAVTSGFNDGQPQVVPDGSALYFVSFRPGVGGGDIYRAPIQTGGQVAAPTIVPVINSSVDDYAPAPSADELAIYFTSNRSDATAKGGYDIWMAKRASRNANFDPPVNVQELNTSADEGASWISPDKCRLYFQRGGLVYVVEHAP
jgi:hypothetical protein